MFNIPIEALLCVKEFQMYIFEVFSKDQHHYSIKFMILWFTVLTFPHNKFLSV